VICVMANSIDRPETPHHAVDPVIWVMTDRIY
jgi:hypothetical protein